MEHDTELEDSNANELRERGRPDVAVGVTVVMTVPVLVLMRGGLRLFLDVEQ
jgi:hypothetical protein